MVGNELGAGNLKRGKLYGTRMMKISFVCGVAMMVLMGISAPFILHFVKLTPQAAVYLKGMFVVLCVYMIGTAPSTKLPSMACLVPAVIQCLMCTALP